ncbi:glycoside hydrolase family 3 protein [Shewanella avicenniae]|uniref:Glycoside hydrolase family 3 protein n=1 Tax=Shewanella avicenniae TaxID=2814294 RepID=A0ABX7QPV0_9GAMM|nr:glycoside hydrolase family 3 C-terminal domain-containing protein [Shewanella avicenniae]QSX32966.1 glycoside hydrolase family 3 protein [Shewanella avicenniae]
MKSFKRTKLSQLIQLAPFMVLLSACGGGDNTPASNNSSTTPIVSNVIAPGMAVSDAEADRRAKSLLNQLTLDQKISLVHGHGSPVGQLGYIGLNYPAVPGAMDKAVGFIPGVAALGIPDNNMVDGSSGVTAEGLQATSLPATVGMAATWSPDLLYQYGKRIGAEARVLGFTTVLGGGINLIRDPRTGRGFEYMGEDPILAGELAAERTIGVQENKMQSTIKHFAFNNMETNRMVQNSIIDEQTMRETELLGFEIAITKGHPSYIMCAFNQVNGEYSCENDYLLNQVLKTEWGFKGMVMSDWGAQSSTVKAALNGLDEEQPGQEAQDTDIPQFMALYMGGPWFIDNLATAVKADEVPMSRLDDMVYRKLRSLIAVGLMDAPPQTPSAINESAGNADAKRFADASMVLMKNDAPAHVAESTPVLPLDKNSVQSIVVVGGYADSGVLSGGGSGGAAPLIENQIDKCGQLPISPYPTCPNYIGDTPLDSLKHEYPNAVISYFDGNDATAAAAAAADADATIIFAAAWFNEGVDNPDMKLASPENNDSGVYTYDQDQLISTVAARAKRSIVVLETGQAVLMPWVDEVDAILNAWYPGVKGAETIADIISGDVNPSGKLPITFPKSEQDIVMPSLPTNLGAFLGAGAMIKSLENTVRNIVTGILGPGVYDALRQVPYTEQLAWNGYKWMDKNNIEPLFAFGHGLSYSTFVYSQGEAKALPNGDVQVTLQIDNNSNRAGTEIAQVYVSLPADVPGNEQPPKRLAGWSRVDFEAQELKTVTVDIPRKYFSTWDSVNDKWIVTPGAYTFTVSDSAAVDKSSNTLVTELNIQ